MYVLLDDNSKVELNSDCPRWATHLACSGYLQYSADPWRFLPLAEVISRFLPKGQFFFFFLFFPGVACLRFCIAWIGCAQMCVHARVPARASLADEMVLFLLV